LPLFSIASPPLLLLALVTLILILLPTSPLLLLIHLTLLLPPLLLLVLLLLLGPLLLLKLLLALRLLPLLLLQSTPIPSHFAIADDIHIQHTTSVLELSHPLQPHNHDLQKRLKREITSQERSYIHNPFSTSSFSRK
jgi:hypothetical protein